MRTPELKKILANIPDSKQRKTIAEILTGKIEKNVRCNSDECKGRIVAYIHDNGKIEPTTDKGVMWLLAYRHRLDGYLGFQCACGNDSRLSDQEKGIDGIENNSVTKKDIEQVWENLNLKPISYPNKNRKQLIDNFLLEEI